MALCPRLGTVLNWAPNARQSRQQQGDGLLLRPVIRAFAAWVANRVFYECATFEVVNAFAVTTPARLFSDSSGHDIFVSSLFRSGQQFMPSLSLTRGS
jgi:hypothetical protein